MNFIKVFFLKSLLSYCIIVSHSETTTNNDKLIPGNESNNVGECTITLSSKKVRRSTFIITSRKTYLAECCGGLKTCVRSKKTYKYKGINHAHYATTKHKFCCKGYEEVKLTPSDGNLKCVPICVPHCINGVCSTPGNCTCDVGYRKNPRSPNECVVFCESPCGNGKCVGINTCECNPGYISKNGKSCSPICPGGCNHGTCKLPDQCECSFGFFRDPKDPHVCKPVCSNGCGKTGKCIAPEICECQEGEFFDSKLRLCASEQKCTLNCRNGTCALNPMRCECKDDYIFNPDDIACVPVCFQICPPLSYCVAPHTCECLDGFKMIDSVCVPQCNPPCEFAQCVGKNQCKCFENYVPDKRSKTKCKPYCRNCIGRCYAPGVCTCYGDRKGYIKGKCIYMGDRIAAKYYDNERYPINKCFPHYIPGFHFGRR